MKTPTVLALLLGSLLQPAISQTKAVIAAAGDRAEDPKAVVQTIEPKKASGWFQRADNSLSLRLLGGTPFHMRVTFHAFPGDEMLKKGLSLMITGDGAYEETWMSPAQWRREVTLGAYHALEASSGRVRKMQASSDYEPSRVLMLLEALMNPIRRDLISEVLRDPSSPDWNIEHLTAGNLSYVRLVSTLPGDYHESYVFLPKGMLIQSNYEGLTTTWQDPVPFAGKAVLRHFVVQAQNRDLLTADVTIEAPADVDAAIFEIPGEQASPGTTLRPLHSFEAKPPSALDGFSYVGNGPTGVVIRDVIDSHAVVHEAEIIAAPDRDVAAEMIKGYRRANYLPAKIDGDPCEFMQIGGAILVGRR